ncbi:MAG: heme ABC transporter permease [Alphaproteobacteria bacterium]|nr:heme ABC transporter permease [Alphaproteobacteria bacterium]
MLHRWLKPKSLRTWMPWMMKLSICVCVITLGLGLYWSLLASPADYQQGDTVRIMYIHVPAAWMAMMIYSIMAGASGAYLVWRNPVMPLIAEESAPLGAAFTFMCLVTGSLWGKPMWGTWWVWDARLTSVLVLFFLYIGYLFLVSALRSKEAYERLTAMLVLIGFVNIPVIKFSVEFWNTLHQPASVIRKGGIAIDTAFLKPLFTMGIAFMALYLALLSVRVLRRLRAG